MPKLITVSENLLKDILPHVKNTPLEKKINDLITNTGKYQTQNISYVFPKEKGKVLSEASGSYFPKKGRVERVVDGDTIVLNNGSIVRYVGITSPETGEPFDKESTEANRKLVEGKEVTLEYDNYKGDKFGRILAYVIVNNTNVSIELAKLGMAQVVIYQHKKPFIYQDKLLQAQDEAKKKKLGIWSK